jgi:putative ABC transport system permease protein
LITLSEITKSYSVGGTDVKALRGVSLNFRENEFVAVLGPSGCGKTTLLNIIGGLDRYSGGDIVINGISTKNYKPQDWDAYRNNSVGFVFQTYYLIPHQTVLSNVKLALTLSGISKSECEKRAKTALEQVGLADQLFKKPNQLSGGQMQRVAIARALVNNPDILLADEPTGALDSETSVQIMELLKEIAETRLVVMVTHNPELAQKYATRTIKLLDGKVISDSAENAEHETAANTKGLRHISMSFRTALSLSFSNLLTKKARTFLTAFAGSIGIIGIALILSLSHGMQTYIARVEEETLSLYPLTIQTEFFDIGGLFQAFDGDGGGQGPRRERTEDHVYVDRIMQTVMNVTIANIQTNDLTRFRAQILEDYDYLRTYTTAIQFHYDIDLNIFMEDGGGAFFQVHPNIVLREFIGTPDGFAGEAGAANPFGALMMGGGDMGGGITWSELIDNPEFLRSTYELTAGRWPENPQDIVLITNRRNTVSDFLLYSLGLHGPEEFAELQRALMAGEILPAERGLAYHFDEILELSYRLVLPVDRFAPTENGWQDASDNVFHMQQVFENSKELNIVGILRPQEHAVAYQSEIIGFTSALTEYIIEAVSARPIAAQQLAAPEIDVFTGRPFEGAEEISFASMDELQFFIQAMPEDEQMQASIAIEAMLAAEVPEQQLLAMLSASINQNMPTTDLEGNLRLMNFNSICTPAQVSIFPSSFENKEAISRYIAAYNERVGDEYAIRYTDFIGMLLGSITTVVNAVSSLLIAFVSISLVVSSIMIGIITYISVLERTKEIGILRSIGASKKDISRVFNAETIIIGFAAGSLGIAVAWLLLIPANIIIYAFTDIHNMAILPLSGAVVLILISILLSFIAGLIPSSFAAKKDPVVALRTE